MVEHIKFVSVWPIILYATSQFSIDSGKSMIITRADDHDVRTPGGLLPADRTRVGGVGTTESISSQWPETNSLKRSGCYVNMGWQTVPIHQERGHIGYRLSIPKQKYLYQFEAMAWLLYWLGWVVNNGHTCETFFISDQENSHNTDCSIYWPVVGVMSWIGLGFWRKISTQRVLSIASISKEAFYWS